MIDLVGQKLGPYSILSERGQDDCGIIYEAEEEPSGRKVQLWILPSSLSHDNTATRRRLDGAIQKLQGFSHPHVPAVYGLVEIGEHLGLVLEHVPGQTLHELLRSRQALPLGQALHIVRDVAAAIDALHQVGVEEIDLRPSHVLIAEDGRAILTDPGLAHLIRSFSVGTRGHLLLGAPEYMAPEVSRGAKPDLQSQVYSLGVLLYQMLAGRPPFQGIDAEVILSHQNREPEPLSQVARRAPRAIDEILGKALAKEPQARYQSAGALAAQLDAHAKPAFTLPSLPRIRLPLGLIAAGIVVLLVAWWGIGELLRDRTSPPAITLAGQTGFVGTYEVIVPKRVRPDESTTIRLAIRTQGQPADELPTVPSQLYGPVQDDSLVGVVPLCKQLWATLDSQVLQIAGPSTLRRTVRDSGAEWVWTVCCKPELSTRKAQPATIRLFAQESGRSQKVLIKEIHFDLETATRARLWEDAELGVAMIGAVMLGLVIMVVVSRQRPRR